MLGCVDVGECDVLRVRCEDCFVGGCGGGLMERREGRLRDAPSVGGEGVCGERRVCVLLWMMIEVLRAA